MKQVGDLTITRNLVCGVRDVIEISSNVILTSGHGSHVRLYNTTETIHNVTLPDINNAETSQNLIVSNLYTSTQFIYIKTDNTSMGVPLILKPGQSIPFIHNGTIWQKRGIINTYPSTGAVSRPVYTNNNDGTCTVSGGLYVLNTEDDLSGNFIEIYINGDTFDSLIDDETNYIVADYNSGNPILRNTIDVLEINESDIIPVFSIYREGTYLGKLNWNEMANGLANKIHYRLVKTLRFQRESGLELGEKATRYVTVEDGIVFYGAEFVVLDSVDSQTDDITFHSRVGDVWSKSTIHQYNNTQYNDDTGLHDLGANRYAVNWIYRCIADDSKMIHIVLGGGNYKLNEATASQPPSNLPKVIRTHSMLVGRIIVQKNIDVATQIDSAFNIVFTPASEVLHNNLDGLQGGIANEYYHLTADELNYIQTEINTSGAFSDLHATGFVSYDGTGNYWEQSGSTFRLLRAGTGRFGGNLVQWTANQEVILTANKGYFLYIDENGILQKKDASELYNSDKLIAFENFKSMFTHAIVLFSAWYDGILMIVSKNNHGCDYTSTIGAHDHFRLGSVFLFTGALISLLSASLRTIQSLGADLIDDHGVLTNVPDYTSTALSIVAIWRNASGYAQRAHRRNFTISAPSVAPTAGATYRDGNNNVHTVITYSAPTLECYASTYLTEAPATGTLTKLTGTGDATLTYSAVTPNRVVPSAYSNSGVYTSLATTGATRFGITAIYALPTDMQTPSTTNPAPGFMALLSTTAYSNVSNAVASLGSGTAPTMTQFVMPTEIEALEPVLMGFVICDGADRQIEAFTGSGFVNGVRSYKQSISSAFSAGAIAVSTANNVTTDTTNFNGILSSADNTTQKALQTIDDWTDGEIVNDNTVYSKEFVDVNSGSITRDGDGNITGIAITGGRTLSITYNVDGTVNTVSDGTRTWTFSYTDGLVSSWSVV